MARQYTMTWTYDLRRCDRFELLIDVKMQRIRHHYLNNWGLRKFKFDDTTPNTFNFDTFTVRPSSNAIATSFDVNSFEVTTNTALVPEPASLLLGVGALGALRVGS